MNYLLAKSNTVSGYGGCTYQEIFEDGVYDGRYARVISASFPTDDAAFIVGFWMTPTAQALPQSIVYRADQNLLPESSMLTDGAGGGRCHRPAGHGAGRTSPRKTRS